MNKIDEIRKGLRLHVTSTPETAKRFFKTAEGSYGAGDEFLGITVPNLRKIAKLYKDIDLQVIQELLQSKYNEERFLALIILVHCYQKSDASSQKSYNATIN